MGSPVSYCRLHFFLYIGPIFGGERDREVASMDRNETYNSTAMSSSVSSANAAELKNLPPLRPALPLDYCMHAIISERISS